MARLARGRTCASCRRARPRRPCASPHEPQIIIRQLLRNASVPSWRSLTMSSTSSSVAHSGASTSYSRSARSPDCGSTRQILTSAASADPTGAVTSTTRRRRRLDVDRRAEVGELHRQQDVGPHRLVRVRLGRVVELDLAHEAVAVDPDVDRLVGRRRQLLDAVARGNLASGRSPRGSGSSRRRRPSPCRSSSPESRCAGAAPARPPTSAPSALEVEAELLAGLAAVSTFIHSLPPGAALVEERRLQPEHVADEDLVESRAWRAGHRERRRAASPRRSRGCSRRSPLSANVCSG